MNTANQPNVKFVQTADYRENYANSVQMRVNVWDFFLAFGTLQQQSETQVEVRNFQGIYLSPQQAKALLGLLQQNVSGYESAFGEIKLDPRTTPPRAGALTRRVTCAEGRRTGFEPTVLEALCRRKILTDHRSQEGRPVPWSSAYPALVFAVIFVTIFLLHVPPLALALLLGRSGILRSGGARHPAHRQSDSSFDAVSNAHPPLVTGLASPVPGAPVGYAHARDAHRDAGPESPPSLCSGVFRPARIATGANTSIAWAIGTALCTAIYPVYLRAELAGAGRSAGRRTHVLGDWPSYVEDRQEEATVTLVRAGGAWRRRPRSSRRLALVWVGVAGLFHPVELEGTLEGHSYTRRPAHPLAAFAASGRAAGRLVRLPLFEDRLPVRQSRVLSLQCRRYAQSPAYSPGAGNAPLATLRIFRPLSPHAGGIAGDVSSAAWVERNVERDVNKEIRRKSEVE
jgi:hypothetical protein